MIKKVLVPLDGSRLSEESIPTAIKIVRGEGDGVLVLLHAVTPSEYFSVTAAQYVQQERRRSAAYLQELAGRIGNGSVQVQERVVTGEASREIVEEAARDRVELIAMSSHGRSGIKDWAFGSVTERVLRSTTLPVLVFRGNVGKHYAIRRIVVAVDESEACLEALIPAAALAEPENATIVLIHVGKERPPSLPVAEKTLRQLHRPFETRLLKGDPAKVLLRAVEDEKADLLALTTVGRATPGRKTFGAVAEEILKSCTRPLLVVNTGRMT